MPAKTPKYRRQKVKRRPDRAFVEIEGARHYLGRYGTKESHRRYDQLIAEWLANDRRLPATASSSITSSELLAHYWNHAKNHYRKPDGSATTTLDNTRQALRPLKALYGPTPASAFGPKRLKAVRKSMIDRGWCRGHVNKQIGKIKAVFRWAVAEELLAANVYHSLVTVTGLQKGRSEAPETEPVRPVPEEHVVAIDGYVSRQVWAMIQFQRLTGARPGEIVGLRPCDLDRSGTVWSAELGDHKTRHHGHRRTIFIGPKAQAIIEPLLTRAPHKPLFSPAEAEAERRQRLHEQRKTPMSCGNVPGSKRKTKPKREPGEQYTVPTYRRAIARACVKAGVPEWRPGQLRHNAATVLRREYGFDVAQTILGHRMGSAVTEVYAEANVAKAIEVMKQIG